MDSLVTLWDSAIIRCCKMEAVDEKLASLWRRSVTLGRRVIQTFDLDKKFRSVQLTAQQHPMLTLVILASVCCLSVPVGAFVMFAAGSIAFTFMGFMFVEGTILTIAGLFLGGILLIVCFVVVTFGGVVFLFVFLLNKLWGALDLAAMSMRRGSKSTSQGRSSGCTGPASTVSAVGARKSTVPLTSTGKGVPPMSISSTKSMSANNEKFACNGIERVGAIRRHDEVPPQQEVEAKPASDNIIYEKMTEGFPIESDESNDDRTASEFINLPKDPSGDSNDTTPDSEPSSSCSFDIVDKADCTRIVESEEPNEHS